MLNRIFVYGTLRPGESRWSALEAYALKQEPATLYGARLYTVGSWPFIVLDGQHMSEVVGELVTVLPYDAPAVIRLLDSIEGYSETMSEKHNLFIRSVQNVYVPAGYPEEDGYLEAYVYLGGFDLAMDAARGSVDQIISGDWKKRNA